MTDRDFIEFANREAEKCKWYGQASEFVQGLAARAREQEKAEAARDRAFSARDAALAEIETAREQAAKLMLKERAEREAVRARDQAAADEAVTKAEARLQALKVEIANVGVALALAEEDRDRRVAALTAEVDALTASRNAIQTEETAIRERLATALGR